MLRKRNPLFIVYPAVAASTEDCATIAPDFHRNIAAQRLVNLLRQLGDVVGVDAPEHVNAIAATRKGQQTLFISFTQPQWLTGNIHCKTIAAFSWPYETVPLESWGEHANHDWRVALRDGAGVITFSQTAATAIADAIGPQLPVLGVNPVLKNAIPAPTIPPRGKPWHLDVQGVVFDSQTMKLATATAVPLPDFTPKQLRISLQGIVYASVLDPIDDAKNWLDTLHGFGIAFRDNVDATLVLKLCHHDTARACMTAMQGLQKLLPFSQQQCRIVIIIAQLDATQYATLAGHSHFYISTAHAHGKGTAILEFMQAGVPIIAPRHTAIREWLNDSNSFAIDCSREWTYWPHDAREKFSTYRYRMVFESIEQQLLRSFAIATSDPRRYDDMSTQAQTSGFRHGAADIAALSNWLATLGITVLPKSPLAASFGDKLGALRRLRHLAARLLRSRDPR